MSLVAIYHVVKKKKQNSLKIIQLYINQNRSFILNITIFLFENFFHVDEYNVNDLYDVKNWTRCFIVSY